MKDYIAFLNDYDRVSIPKIQREYVQGNHDKIGQKFVENI